MIGWYRCVSTHRTGGKYRVSFFASSGFLGLTRAALGEAVKYAKTRRAFGHPMGEYQFVPFRGIFRDPRTWVFARGAPYVQRLINARSLLPELKIR